MKELFKSLVGREKQRPVDFSPCYTAYTAGGSHRDEKKTIVIFGAPRGGTTMVAGVAIKCGLFLGDELPINCEDPNFNIRQLKLKNLPIALTIRETLRERNDTIDSTWGWKFPRAAFYLDQVFDCIRNPHFIIVYRDPVATGSRAAQDGTPIEEALDQVLALHRMNLDAAEKYRVPTLFMSYDRALAARERTITSLCDFIGLPTPGNKKEILAYMEPGRYKPS
jgi:hypothetical protein